MTWLEHRVPPPLVALIVAASMWAVAQTLQTYPIDPELRIAIAVGLALLGVAIAGAGVQTFGRAKTTINPVNIDATTALVTEGIFSLTRNPMYLGIVLVLLGWAVFLSSPWLIFGPLLFAAFIERFQILPEEKMLLAKFGQSFIEYRQRVRRWM